MISHPNQVKNVIQNKKRLSVSQNKPKDRFINELFILNEKCKRMTTSIIYQRCSDKSNRSQIAFSGINYSNFRKNYVDKLKRQRKRQNKRFLKVNPRINIFYNNSNHILQQEKEKEITTFQSYDQQQNINYKYSKNLTNSFINFSKEKSKFPKVIGGSTSRDYLNQKIKVKNKFRINPFHSNLEPWATERKNSYFSILDQ